MINPEQTEKIESDPNLFLQLLVSKLDKESVDSFAQDETKSLVLKLVGPTIEFR